MNKIVSLLHFLNKNEQKSLYKYITRSNDNSKMVTIFHGLKQRKEDRKIQKQLGININLYRRLKSAVVKEIFKGINILYYDFDKVNEGLHLYLLGRIMKEKNQPHLAEYFFKKAEKHMTYATASLRYLLYAEWLDLSIQWLFENPDDIIQKREAALEQLKTEATIDAKASRLLYSIKVSQNFSTDKKLINEMEQTLQTIRKTTLNTPAVRWKFYDTVSRILLQKKDYKAIIQITRQTIQEFQKKQWFTRDTHEYKLKMLINLINSYFLTHHFDRSLETLAQLEKSLREYKNLYYARYCFFFYNGMVMNYSITDKHKAVKILLDALNDRAFRATPENILYANLHLAVQYFDLMEYKKAITHLVKTVQHPSFDKLDRAFQIKIIMLEIILRYHQEDEEYCESLIQKVLRMSKKIKQKGNIMNDLLICNMIHQLLHEKTVNKKEIIQTLHDNHEKYQVQDLIKYDEWVEKLQL